MTTTSGSDGATSDTMRVVPVRPDERGRDGLTWTREALRELAELVAEDDPRGALRACSHPANRGMELVGYAFERADDVGAATWVERFDGRPIVRMSRRAEWDAFSDERIAFVADVSPAERRELERWRVSDNVFALYAAPRVVTGSKEPLPDQVGRSGVA